MTSYEQLFATRLKLVTSSTIDIKVQAGNELLIISRYSSIYISWPFAYCLFECAYVCSEYLYVLSFHLIEFY